MTPHSRISRDPRLVASKRTWWVWRDPLLEEWFYTDIDPASTPGLVAQLQREGVVIQDVQADTGRQAIEILTGQQRRNSSPKPRIH